MGGAFDMEVVVQSDERHWPQTDRVWRQFALMDLVMERMDVDPGLAARNAGGGALAEARNTCLGCSFHRECRRWLEAERPPSELAQFCPNAGFFQECSRHRA